MVIVIKMRVLGQKNYRAGQGCLELKAKIVDGKSLVFIKLL